MKFDPTHKEHSPHKHSVPIYGTKTQYTLKESDLPTLSKKEATRVQQIVGSLLYYAQAVDPTLLVALG